MKKHYIAMALLLGATTVAQAQDTYLNDRLTATDDLFGSSRYVGMGGAMGALGADLSVISSNPAGIGLYRKSEIGLTFGAVVPGKTNGWNSSDYRTYGEKLPRAAFDQMGFVFSMRMSGKVKYVNLAVNYQKKANYNLGFYADNANLGGLSQMDQLGELANMGYDTDYNLAGLAYDNGFFDERNEQIYNRYRGEYSYYTRHQRGSLQGYDFNLSFNVNDRFYTGLTFGLDNVNYLSWSSYSEMSADYDGNYGDHTLYNDRQIDGTGLNVKLGFIARPMAERPFRVGLTVETPTWYRMKNSTLYDLSYDVEPDNYITHPKESYIETTLRTPWRARLSMGSTVDNFLAWGIEYEYANPAKTKMGYPTWDWNDSYHSPYSNSADRAMNQQTKHTLRGQHTLRLGLEAKPIDAVAVRVGYNFISNRYKANPTFDQFSIDSKACDYLTSTDYMSLSAANIVTFGLGFKYKKFYADLAYKYRMQNAKFYAFDTSFTQGEDFIADHPDLKGATIQPVDLNLERHQVQLSLGFKF